MMTLGKTEPFSNLKIIYSNFYCVLKILIETLLNSIFFSYHFSNFLHATIKGFKIDLFNIFVSVNFLETLFMPGYTLFEKYHDILFKLIFLFFFFQRMVNELGKDIGE